MTLISAVTHCTSLWLAFPTSIQEGVKPGHFVLNSPIENLPEAPGELWAFHYKGKNTSVHLRGVILKLRTTGILYMHIYYYTYYYDMGC